MAVAKPLIIKDGLSSLDDSALPAALFFIRITHDTSLQLPVFTDGCWLSAVFHKHQWLKNCMVNPNPISD
jgi:hypothetical protein